MFGYITLAACIRACPGRPRRALISRRTFLETVAAAVTCPSAHPSLHASRSDVLYNGIVLGSPWPPRWQYPAEHPIRPPYLADPPRVIPINVGRQLFVDDFLIEDTTLTRTSHRPEYHSANPIVRPDQPWEQRDDSADRIGTGRNPTAMPFSDGVFFDPHERVFKMWYMGGYGRSTCLATSDNGVAWRKQPLDVVPGTNIVLDRHRDSSTVWLDQNDRDPRSRFKMSLWADHRLTLLVSPDGVHWTEIGTTGAAGDRSTFFFNPFRQVWVFSVRGDQFDPRVTGRFRRYWEGSRFDAARNWNARDLVAWLKADSRDFAIPTLAARPELYNLDCVAYESVLVGLFSIWRGESSAREKVNEITVGFSRDGFHWHRPDRRAFLPVSTEVGSWNWANVQSAGGGCLIVGDQLFFYVSGRQGRPGTPDPGTCTTGLATLRRDGFASMDWRLDEAAVRRQTSAPLAGTLTTRPVRFSGEHLFVNADVRGGELRVEALDEAGIVIDPFDREACVPVSGDGTKLPVRWTSAPLGALAGRTVRLRFSLTRGRLYAFWVSPWPSGESRGYPAAGGPGFTGPTDRPRAT